MFTNENNIEERIQELPNDLKKEVLDYIDFLLNKYKSKDIKKADSFKFNWEGGLSDANIKISSVDFKIFAIRRDLLSRLLTHSPNKNHQTVITG